MNLSPDHDDIDRAISEFELAVGGLFRQGRIDELKRTIKRLKKDRKNTSRAQRKLELALCDQMNWDLRAIRVTGAGLR